MVRAVVAVSFLWVVGCGGEMVAPDAMPDSRLIDSSPDAPGPADTGLSDASPADAEPAEGGPADASLADAMAMDAASADADSADAAPDAAVPLPRSWGSPLLIARNAGGPRVATDDDGNATVTFVQAVADRASARTARFDAALGRFGPTINLEDEDMRYAGLVDIGVSGSGSATAIWALTRTAVPTSTTDLFTSRRSLPAGDWSMPALVEEGGRVNYPFLEVSRAGTGFAIWSYRGSISAARHTATGMWDMPLVVAPSGSGSVVYPRVGVNDSGSAIAVWTRNDGGRTIEASLFTGVSWSAPVRLDVIDGEDSQYPRPVIAPDGTILVVWAQDDARGDHSVWSTRYDPRAGRWSTATTIETVRTHTDRPVIAMDAAGNAVCVWVHGFRSIWEARYDAMTASWAAPREILARGVASATDLTDNDLLNIASDASGNVTVIWVQDDGSGEALWSMRYDATSRSWGTPSGIATGRGNVMKRDLAITPSGVVTLVWSERGATDDVFALRFE